MLLYELVLKNMTINVTTSDDIANLDKNLMSVARTLNNQQSQIFFTMNRKEPLDDHDKTYNE